MPKSYTWFDKYVVLDELGEGGNAKVFWVREKTSNEEFALKNLLNKKSSEKKSRFIEEINIASQNYKDIDGIIPILEASPKEYWYTMPVAQSILKHIENTDERVEQIILGVIQIAETLSQLHAKGISHRDIKPGNIYYYNQRYFLGDFGLVDHPDNPHDYTRSDKGLGAIFTIAPEMKRDPKNADGKMADVFSLAKTTWMLLSGDDRGFDGVYDFLDRSHSLRFSKKYKGVHIVELEELLAASTNNNPTLRPDINSFKQQLVDWRDIFLSHEKSQLSDWKFLNKYLFGNIPSDSAVWKYPDKIINILNIVGSIPAYNHMLFSEHGGLDFDRAQPANEDGCIYIYTNSGSCLITKPKCLHYESFVDSYEWNYFLLELDKLTPVLSNRLSPAFEHERLVEDYPAHYVSAENVQYGVYDYDSGTPLPADYKVVDRYLCGKLLIVLKNGPYNNIPATYDGRHGMCSNDEFRVYISTLIGMANRFKKLNVKNSIYLNSDAFSSNPFCRKESFSTLFRASENANEESCKEFIYAHIKEWCFKDLIEESLDAGIIKFYFTFRNNSDFYQDMFSEEVLCIDSDGFIIVTNKKALGAALFIYNRNEALAFRKRVDNLIIQNCIENGMNAPAEMDSLFDLNLIKAGKPTHQFTKSEIAEAMRNADDRYDNKLVIDENGYAHVIQDTAIGILYPVSHETWAAGNVIVGKYSKLFYLDDDYISSLQGWLDYLQTGHRVYMDHVLKNSNETELIKAISEYY